MSLIGGEKDHFGIDIGTNHVRLAELGRGSTYSLRAYGQAPIASGIAQSDSKLDIQKLAKTISDLVKYSKVSSRNAVSAIPGTSVFNATIKLPPMSQTELEKAIKYQAEQNIPLKIEDVKYDYQILNRDQTTKELTVMIIAATKNKVNQMIELLTQAGLNVLALETSTVALARSLSLPNVPVAMILDIGITTTDIAVVDGGVLAQTRSFPLAGFGMTRAISQNLSLDMEQAEQFKRRFGFSKDKLEGQVYRSIEPIFRDILEEASRSASFFEEVSGKKIERIILTGGSSRLPLMAEFVKSHLNVDVSFGNPWANVSHKSSQGDKINEVAPEFATAVGLAMRS